MPAARALPKEGQEMNDNAKKWVAALRDPDANQTTGRLEDENGQCCLGVACRLYAGEFPDWPVIPHSFEQPATCFGEAQDDGILPRVVTAWLGLADDEATFTDPNQESLTGMNDDGIPFSEIADLIESEPEGLFR